MTNSAMATVRTLILDDVGIISTDLVKKHTIEWYHVRKARLEKAKKDAEAESESESESS